MGLKYVIFKINYSGNSIFFLFAIFQIYSILFSFISFSFDSCVLVFYFYLFDQLFFSFVYIFIFLYVFYLLLFYFYLPFISRVAVLICYSIRTFHMQLCLVAFSVCFVIVCFFVVTLSRLVLFVFLFVVIPKNNYIFNQSFFYFIRFVYYHLMGKVW